MGGAGSGKKPKDLSGALFGRLTAIQISENRSEGGRILWECRCSCGTTCLVSTKCLRGGETRSCGCLAEEQRPLRNLRHGMNRKGARDPSYTSWYAMRTRCYNPKSKDFSNYGGRGIKVVYLSFSEFLADVGPRPGPGYTIDRVDVNKDYEPGNCRWATTVTQRRNCRTGLRPITWRGKTQLLVDWSRELKISMTCLRYRLSRGWSLEQAFTLPSAAVQTDAYEKMWDTRRAKEGKKMKSGKLLEAENVQ